MSRQSGETEREERPGLLRAVVALQHRDFRLLWFASLAQAMGGQMQSTASLWQIYLLTGSALHIGLTGLARFIPLILFSLIGGVAADRLDRRRVIRFSQAANGAISVALAALTITGLIDVWHIYVSTFLGASLMAISSPARQAVTASLVPRHHLTNAVALNFSIWQLALFVAPSVAGVLIATAGLAVTYGANGLALLVTFITLGFVRFPPLPERPRRNAVQDLLEGLRFVRVRSIILVLLGADSAANLFGSYQTLLPILAGEMGLGAAGYGFLAAAPGVGAIIGTTLIMSFGEIRYQGYLVVGSILAFCVCLVGLAVSPWFVPALIAAGLLGLTDSLQAAPRSALIQLVTPDELRGRVSSFQQMLTAGVPQLGQTVVGAGASLLGPSAALIYGAVACAAINVGILLGRQDMRARDLAEVALAQAAREAERTAARR